MPSAGRPTGPSSPTPARHDLAGVACLSSALLMTELALTRIFSVVMYYHFAFLAISIALFGLSASGVFVYVRRETSNGRSPAVRLSRQSLVYSVITLVSLFWLVRLRVGLNYTPRNLALMLTIYAFAALPFFSGGLALTLAISRFAAGAPAIYAADLIGAAAGCLALIPLLDWLGAPGVVLTAAALGVAACLFFAPPGARLASGALGGTLLMLAVAGHLTSITSFDVRDTKGHQGDRVLFSKWNSFSRVAVYARPHGDWSLSPAYRGPRPDTRFMDIDSAASTPILGLAPDLSNVQYLRYELTAVAYHVVSDGGTRPGFKALVIGPGGGRDLISALVFGADHVDAVEINPIIARDVMGDRFREFSGGIYGHPRVRVAIDDGRSFVRSTAARFDVIQASLVDTWAATAAGAYTLTENTLYTVEAFDDYLDHLTDGGILTITRWVFDGLRLVSLAQEVCAARGWDPRARLAVVQRDRVATFLLKRSPFTEQETRRLHELATQLQFHVLYPPPPDGTAESGGDAGSDGGGAGGASDGSTDEWVDGTRVADFRRLILAPDRRKFYASYPQDIRPTTDDRPFFFHTTRLRDQIRVAFGRSMLFGNGLSALLTLMGLSGALVLLFLIVPLGIAGGAPSTRWLAWLLYFGSLGAGFMLIEVSLLQRFVLMLGHPVYSLTVTLFSLLLGTGLGAMWSRRYPAARLRRAAGVALLAIALLAAASAAFLTPLVSWAVPFARTTRILIAVATLMPLGFALGFPMPSGIRLLAARSPDIVPWAWGMNGALSVVGATVAVFLAMNWGFSATLLVAAGTYLVGLGAWLSAG